MLTNSRHKKRTVFESVVSMLEIACTLWPMLSEKGKEQIMIECDECFDAALRLEYKMFLEEKSRNGGKCLSTGKLTPKGREIEKALSAYLKLSKLATGIDFMDTGS